MAKKLPKAPKKPKRSAPYSSWENYDARVKDWEKRCKEIISEKSKKEKLIRKYSGGSVMKHKLKRVA